jgi:N-acetylmuramoyl-L-alanine amidase
MKKIIILASAVMLTSLASFTNKPKVKVLNHAIFGEKYARIEVQDNSLEGKIFYLISGHGGIDPGAVTTVDGVQISEDEYAYDVTLRLARNIISKSGTAYMITRDTDGIRDERLLPVDKDETVWNEEQIPHKQSLRLRQRVETINKLVKENSDIEKQFAIEIHVDSRHEDQNVDVFFYHQSHSVDSEVISNCMVDTFVKKYNKHQKGRGYSGIAKARDLYTLRKTKVPTVYIELGNITNIKDQKRILDPNNRQAISNWLVQSLEKTT